MRLSKLVLFSCVAAAASAWAAEGPLPLEFEANYGQFPSRVAFAARGPAAGSLPIARASTSIPLALNVYLTFPNAAASDPGQWQPREPSPGTTTYRVGSDPAKWHSGIPRYRKLHWAELYPGIALQLYGANGRLEYDFVVEAQAHPEAIRMRFEGASQLALDSSGNLVISTAAGAIVQRKPISYQNGHSVGTRYRLVGVDEAALDFDGYDRNAPLTVDPIVESLLLLGGASDDKIVAAGPDFSVGMTASVDFPGVLAASHRNIDVFVRYNPTGDTLIIGGSGDEIVTSVKTLVPYGGTSLIIGGYTDSRDLPVAPSYVQNGYFVDRQTTYGGGDHDGFVLYLHDPRSLDMLSYIGGSGDDRVTAVAQLPQDGSIIAVGTTTSTDLPLARNGPNPPSSGFVSILGAYGSVSGTYIGGTDGADTPLALAVSGAEFYVGGETRSSDWQPGPAWGGGVTRQPGAAADAFLLHFHWTGIYSDVIAPIDAALWGGSGDDRITAIDLRRDGRLAAAGTTGSSELPGYRGGASDAFLLNFSRDLQTRSGLVLVGGAGADEGTSVAVNRFDETAIGGWTNSKDLALRDPLQPAFGGGPDDGFAAIFDEAGVTILSTYIGGSGSEQIRGVLFDSNGQRLFAAGYSSSQDLSLQNSAQGPAGGTDGLIVALRPLMIHASTITGGKDLTALPVVGLGDEANATGVPLTVTSSDPSLVTLGQLPEDSGTASIIVSSGAQSIGAYRTFRLYCLADRGGASLSLSAPGYSSRTVPVRCVPGGVYAGPSVIQLSGVSTGGSISVTTGAIDPATGSLIEFQAPRIGTAPLTVTAAVDDSTIVSLGATVQKLMFDAYSTNAATVQGIGFSPLKAGSANVTITASPGWTIYPSSTVRIDVLNGSMFIAPLTVGQGMVAQISYYPSTSIPSPPPPVELSVSDVSKARLTLSPFTAGQKSLTVTCCSSAVYLEVLDSSGPVSVTATSPNSKPTTVPVRIQPPAAGFLGNTYSTNGPTTPSLQLNQGQKQDLKAIVWSGVTPNYANYPALPVPRAGSAPISLRIVNSNPAVVSATASTATWNPGTNFQLTFSVTALSAGSATLTLESDDVKLQVQPLVITVPGPSLTLNGATIGKDLQVPISVFVVAPPSNNPQTITLTSSDPSRLLLATDSKLPGQASLITAFSYNTQVFAQALAGSGDVTITASGAGLASGTSTIHLVPSAIGWGSNAFSLTRSGDGPGISAWALDPATLTTSTTQQLRPGVDGVINIQNSNPSVATVDTPSISLQSFSSGNNGALMTIVGTGKTELSIIQPDGFTSPVGRRPLPVTVTRPPAQFQTQLQLGVNQEISTSIVLSDGPAQMTLTSSDPSKLLLSTSVSDLGNGTIAIKRRADGGYQTFYLQAIDGPSDVVLTVSGDGMDTVKQTVTIQPSVLQFSDLYSTGRASDGSVTLNVGDTYPQSISIGALGLDGYGRWSATTTGGVLRPGYDLSLPIQNSKPAVAAASNSVLFNSLTSGTSVSIKALAGGTTELTIPTPPGFTIAPPGVGRTTIVNVRGVTISTPDVMLSSGLQVRTALNVPAGAAVSDVDVTITSGDPSKVLLSADGGIAGSGSVTVHYSAANPSAAAFYVQGLADSGTVPLQINASGVGGSQANVSLSPWQFFPEQYSLYLSLGADPQDFHFSPRPANSNNSTIYQFRAGVAPFDITAFSSDTSVLLLLNDTARVNPGDTQVTFKLQPVSEGSAALSLNVPTQPSPIQVQVRGGSLSMIGYFNSIAKDFQDSLSVQVSSSGSPAGTPPAITITSADPTRLLVSASPTTPGQASVIITGTQPKFYLQALAGSGSVVVTASATGYGSTNTTVQLGSASLWLQAPSSIPTLTPLSSPVSFNVNAGFRNTCCSNTIQTLRPGASPITVTVSSLDSSVGTITPAQVTFNPGESGKSIAFQPKAAGVTLLTLSLPPGFLDVPSDRQQLLTVLAPQLNLPSSISIGKDMLKVLPVGAIGQLGSAIALTFTSSDPSRVLLSTASTATPAAAVTINLSQINNGTQYLYLIALADSGSVTLRLSSPTFPEGSYSVSLEPSGFYFPDDSLSGVYSGNFARVSINFGSLIPGTLAPHEPGVLRPGAPPASIAITSSNTAIAASSTFAFPAGSTTGAATFLAKTPGGVTLTLSAPAGYSQPSSKTSLSVTVQ